MKPADLVIARFGGVRPLARLLEIDHTTILQWQRKPPRGRDGLIPSRYHIPLLELAARLDVALSTDDLIHGVVA